MPNCDDLGVKVLKFVEGLRNKGFLLTMDNGMEVFAKLPNPNAGPAHYTTASEVATREFVSARRAIGLGDCLLTRYHSYATY